LHTRGSFKELMF